MSDRRQDSVEAAPSSERAAASTETDRLSPATGEALGDDELDALCDATLAAIGVDLRCGARGFA